MDIDTYNKLVQANLENMTSHELLEVATKIKVTGRHKMNKTQLIFAIGDMLADFDAAAISAVPEKKAAKKKAAKTERPAKVTSYDLLQSFLDTPRTIEQIAKELDMGVPSAQSLISRARRKGYTIIKDKNKWFSNK